MTAIDSLDRPAGAGSCQHNPPCPSVEATDRDAAHVIAAHPEQGWSLLCNGIVMFDDFGELLPDGRCLGDRQQDLLSASPHRRAC